MAAAFPVDPYYYNDGKPHPWARSGMITVDKVYVVERIKSEMHMRMHIHFISN